MRRGLWAATPETSEELLEAFPQFLSKKQQGASCDKHDHFNPAESCQDHRHKFSVFALTTRWSGRNAGASEASRKTISCPSLSHRKRTFAQRSQAGSPA
jgi:hypothetical protein